LLASLLVLTLLPLISAVDIGTETTYRSNGLSTSITFNTDALADSIEVTSSYIYFENLKLEQGGLDYDCNNINITDTFETYTETDLLSECTLTTIIGGGSGGTIDEEDILGNGTDSTPLIIRNDTIISSGEVSLDSIGVKVGDWFYGYKNKITALTYDLESNLIEVDSIDFEILGDVLYTKDIVRDKTGRYTATLFLLTEADNVTIEITAIQGIKTEKIRKELIITRATKSQEVVRKAGNILERAINWSIENKMEVGFGILIILVIFITMFIYSDNKKK